MSSSTTVTLDDYKAQLTANMIKLSKKKVLDIDDVLSHLESPLFMGLIMQYSTLSCEPTSFLQAIITAVGAISGEIVVQNPTKIELLPLNLFTHLIGEPGTQKTTIIRVIRHAMSKLDKLFPGIYSKYINEQKISMFIQSETELSISEKMAHVGDVFAICDEIDSFLERLSVFSTVSQMGSLGTKMVLQSFDLIQDETRGTGSNTHTITSAKLTILGSSTGEKYATNMLKFNSKTGNDGVIARIGLHIVPPMPTNVNAPSYVFTSIPNILHCLIIIHYLALEKIELRFEKLQCDIDDQFIPIIPKWLVNLRTRHNIQKPVMQSLIVDVTPVPINAPKLIDFENDGYVLSAFGLVKQHIERDINEANMSDEIKPYIKALLRKTGVKLPRYCGCYQLLYQSIIWCEEIIEKINFVAGSHVLNQEIDLDFVDAAQKLVQIKIKQLPKNSSGRPILLISKAAVIAANKHYQYTKQSSIELFSTDDIDQIVAARLLSASLVKEALRKLRTEKKSTFNEKYIMLTMNTPFIIASWLSTKTNGICWTGKWNKNVASGRAVLNNLEQAGVLIQGSYIMYAKDKSYMKATPASIRRDPVKLTNLESFHISIEEYEYAYKSMNLPTTTKLSREGVSFLRTCPDFIPYYHLYNQIEMIKLIKQLLDKGELKVVIIDNSLQYMVNDELIDDVSQSLNMQHTTNNVIRSSSSITVMPISNNEELIDDEQENINLTDALPRNRYHSSSMHFTSILDDESHDESIQHIIDPRSVTLVEQYQRSIDNALEEAATFDNGLVQTTFLGETNTTSVANGFQPPSSSVASSTFQTIVTPTEINEVITNTHGLSSVQQQNEISDVDTNSNRSNEVSDTEIETPILHQVSRTSNHIEHKTDNEQCNRLLLTDVAQSHGFPQQNTDNLNNPPLNNQHNALKRKNDLEEEYSRKRVSITNTNNHSNEHISNENTCTISLLSNAANVISGEESIN